MMLDRDGQARLNSYHNMKSRVCYCAEADSPDPMSWAGTPREEVKTFFAV